MKKFIIHILIVGVVLVTIASVLDYSYDYIFLNTSSRDKVQLALKQKHDYVDYLFLGSSRVENHVDCDLIQSLTGKSCVNYGISGGSYEDSLVLLHLLKQKGLTYGHLFIQLDNSIEDGGMTKNFKASLIPFIAPYELKIEGINISLSWSQKNIPFYRYAQYDYLYGIRSCAAQILKNQDEIKQFGYKPQYGIGSHFSGLIKKTPIKNKYIEFIKKEAIRDNAQIHFFTSPYCPSMKNTGTYNRFKSYYPGYINYASYYSNPTYFANCSHMNNNGAQVFTKQIVKDFNL
ncbi:hypothetical protein [Nonlabens antarcticus]|uniref:hypothetical protein n=1 Tax=Nonlabens antarcticus TaxID=392714 RepID=UPI001891BB8D|nr:hypothetical protein [Nonlabens antarcticus]